MPGHLDVTPGRRIGRWAVFGFEALVRRPGVEQGAVDGEVVTGQVATQLGLADHRREELVGHVVGQQPGAVLGERGGVEGGLVDTHVQEPLDVMKERGLRSPWETEPDRLEASTPIPTTREARE